MNENKNDDSWKQTAITLATQPNLDFSWREIARILEKPKSTVSDLLREYFKAKYGDDEGTKQVPKDVKILLLDVETAPITAYVWGRWDQSVADAQVVSEGYILTYSAKWLGGDVVMSNRITEKGNDKHLVFELSELFDQADIIVCHNAQKFDIPLIKTRMIALGMNPPLPAKIVDTLRICRQEFRFPSNRLDSVAIYLGLPRKKQNSGFDLWRRCMDMEDKAFDEMLEYNIQDVVVLEELYLRLRSWSKNHPNVSLYRKDGKPCCVSCGGECLEPTDKSYYTAVSEFKTLKCTKCGKINRKRQNVSKQNYKDSFTNC